MSRHGVVIVDGVRSAVGTCGGSLKDVTAADVGALVVREAVRRSGVDPDAVDEVILGCVGQVSADAYIARVAAVKAGIPVRSTAQTVNRLSGSGLQALVTAAQWLQLDDAQVVVAGGAENMSRLPYYVWNRWGRRLGSSELEHGVLSAVSDPFKHYAMGVTAERVAEKYGVSRQEQDALALDSQQRARAAIADGRFTGQIVPVDTPGGRGRPGTFQVDEHPRETTAKKLAALKPAFAEGGTVTAGNASGINDGAAAVVMTTAAYAADRGLQPRARLVGYGFSGIGPEIMDHARTRGSHPSSADPCPALPFGHGAGGAERGVCGTGRRRGPRCGAGLGPDQRERRSDCAGTSRRRHRRYPDGEAAP